MSVRGAERTKCRRGLVVDDHVHAAEAIARLLELCGYEVRQAHDGLQALECVVEMRPQIILLDLHLPKLDGLAVARHIRALDLPTQPIIVAVTALGSAQDRHRGRCRIDC